MKHCGGDLPRVHSECLQKIGIQVDRDYSQLVIMARKFYHSIPNSHVLRQKAPAHVKHRDGVPFVKDPLLN